MYSLDKTDFSFTYTNTVEDVSALNLYSFAVSPHFKRNIWNGRIFVLSYVVVAVLYAVFRMEQIFDKTLMIGSMAVIGILWYFLFPQFYRNSIKDEAFARLRRGRLKLSPITVNVSGGRLSVTRDDNTRQIAAEEVLSAEMTADKIYVILQEEQDSLVISDSEVSPDMFAAFASFLAETFSDKVLHTGVTSR